MLSNFWVRILQKEGQWDELQSFLLQIALKQELILSPTIHCRFAAFSIYISVGGSGLPYDMTEIFISEGSELLVTVYLSGGGCCNCPIIVKIEH